MSPEPREGFDPEELPPWETDDYGWEDPIPLGAMEPDPFPNEAFDVPWLAQWIEAEAEATQTPPDLAGVASLAALSAACHGAVVIEVRPGYREPVNLYVACALDSGNRKSAVFADATEPIYSVETELTEGRREQVAISQGRRRILEKRLAEAEMAAAKGKDPTEADAPRVEAQELASELANLPVAVPLRFVVDDITPEALSNLLPEQRGVVSVL